MKANANADLFPRDGAARLLISRNIVMFPHAVLPLEVVADREVALVEDALRGNQCFAMAACASEDPTSRTPVYPMGCFGSILHSQRVDAHCYRVVFMGLTRVRLVKSLPLTEAFDRAMVEQVDDVPPPAGSLDTTLCRDTILKRMRLLARRASRKTAESLALIDYMANLDDLGAMCDMASFVSAIPFANKVELLLNPNVEERLRHLSDRLGELIEQRDAAGDSEPFGNN